MKIKYQYEEENDYSFRRGLKHNVISFIVMFFLLMLAVACIAGFSFFLAWLTDSYLIG